VPAPRHRRNTFRLTNRSNAVVVLFAVTGLALSWVQVTFSSLPEEVPANASSPVAQHAKRSHHGKRDRQTAPPARVRPAAPATEVPTTAAPTTAAPSTASQGTAGPSVHARGADIGWPQCPPNVGFRGRHGLGQPMPGRETKFVIIGLTNGRAFTPNPCLDMHLRWARAHKVFTSAYAFAAYPSRTQLLRYRFQGPFDGSNLRGRLMNSGHAAALYNVRVMQQHGFVTPHVWLDVEPSSSRPWSSRTSQNSAVVRGWIRGYRDAGYTVGFYSTTNLWRPILGGLRLGLPEWRTAGPASSRAALEKCDSGSFQGGPAVIAQWWTARRDFDRICPAAARSNTLGRYFHKW
jgi:hypothetical protein